MPGVKFIIFFTTNGPNIVLGLWFPKLKQLTKYKLTATFFKLITSNLYFLIKTIINAVI